LYAKTLHIDNFKCFGQVDVSFQYPGRGGEGVPVLDNVNLILGDNGGGKTSILRAIAVAILGQTLSESGFVAWRLVRRAKPGGAQVESAQLAVEMIPATEKFGLIAQPNDQPFELTVHLEAKNGRAGNEIDKLSAIKSDLRPLIEMVFDLVAAAPFIVGYGATRRLETGDYSESSARRSRGPRYARVAGLFEDHLALRPIQIWANKIRNKDPLAYTSALEKFNQVLPDNVRFTGEFEDDDGQAIFMFNDAPTPLMALSDGYKSFIGWVGDLIGQLLDVADGKCPIDQMIGIVLLDEIDLHLHPAWQRSVVPALAKAFPCLQFFFTSHSPLVAATVQHENVFITDIAPDGTAMLKQIEEHVYGRGIEELLLSSYFGLESTRPEAFQEQGRALFLKAASGDSSAALEYLQRFTGQATAAAATNSP
jgi:predicted ATPase